MPATLHMTHVGVSSMETRGELSPLRVVVGMPPPLAVKRAAEALATLSALKESLVGVNMPPPPAEEPVAGAAAVVANVLLRHHVPGRCFLRDG